MVINGDGLLMFIIAIPTLIPMGFQPSLWDTDGPSDAGARARCLAGQSLGTGNWGHRCSCYAMELELLYDLQIYDNICVYMIWYITYNTYVYIYICVCIYIYIIYMYIYIYILLNSQNILNGGVQYLCDITRGYGFVYATSQTLWIIMINHIHDSYAPFTSICPILFTSIGSVCKSSPKVGLETIPQQQF